MKPLFKIELLQDERRSTFMIQRSDGTPLEAAPTISVALIRILQGELGWSTWDRLTTTERVEKFREMLD